MEKRLAAASEYFTHKTGRFTQGITLYFRVEILDVNIYNVIYFLSGFRLLRREAPCKLTRKVEEQCRSNANIYAQSFPKASLPFVTLTPFLLLQKLSAYEKHVRQGQLFHKTILSFNKHSKKAASNCAQLQPESLKVRVQCNYK